MSQWVYKIGVVYRDYSYYFTHIHQQCVVLCIRNQPGEGKRARSEAAAAAAAATRTVTAATRTAAARYSTPRIITT